VAFAPDGKTLASASWDNTVRLWDTSRPDPREKAVLRGYADRVWSVAFALDGRSLASGVQDGSVRVFDLTGSVVKERLLMQRHRGAVRALVYLPGGKALASADEAGLVVLWDAVTGETLWDWQLPGAVSALAAAPDGRHLALGNSNTTVYILRLSGLPAFRG
jgi:WD40 repeat protein